MKHFTNLFFCCALFFASSVWAQKDTASKTNSKLPFAIDKSKRLPEIEIEEKKEGTFFTGLPRLEFDPIRGFGAGGNVNLFVNQTKEDPFFEYTPYRHRVNAEFFIFRNGRVRYALNYDAPYVFNSKWRIRADAVLWEDPNVQYWGIGRNYTLQPLRFRDKKGGSGFRTFNSLKEYEENLAIAEFGRGGLYFTDLYFNNLQQRTQLYNLLSERTFFGGRLRLMFGYEALFNGFESYSGHVVEGAKLRNGTEVNAVNNNTLVDLQQNDGTWDRFNLSGFNDSKGYMFTSMLAGAIIYDTRDFEPDPSKGLFLQYSHEYSAPWFGSQFNFNKFMLQGQWLHTFVRWREGKSRITFAGLIATGHIFGSKISFIEMFDLSSQAEAGGISVLGGGRSLRGFREARFLAPTVSLINLELRSRLYDFRLLNQYFTVGLTPFYDVGSVFDRPADFTFSDWRGAPGLGARLAWNQSTILRLDHARSKEGSQTFFGFGHIF
jgi:hypothetical protein